MIKNKILIFAIFFLSASCSFGGKTIVSGTVKTVNGGTDWQFANRIVSSKSTIATLNVQKLAFDPNNRQVTFVGGDNGGLYQWDPNNNAWKQILSNILVYDFVVTPQDSKTIYVAGLFNNHGRVVVTKDGGATWSQIFNDATNDNPVRALALNPANPNQIAIGLSTGSVIKSADGGLSWQLAKDFSDRVNRMLWQGDTLYVLLQTKGLVTSTDFGGTFTPISSGIDQTAGQTNQSSGSLIYNQFFVDTVTPKLIYVTSNQGLFKSIDGGQTWTHLSLPIENGQNVARAIAVAKTSSNLVFTSIDSTVYKSTDGGSTWQTQKVATNGIINYIIVDPELPQIAWAGIYGAQ